MNDAIAQDQLSTEVLDFIHSRKSLQLSTITPEGRPYASYAPFAIGTGNECLYVLLSEIAVHAGNLRTTPRASVLIIQDEDSAEELFARVRVNYAVDAEQIAVDSDAWSEGINTLTERHGERINSLSKLADFKLFKLKPTGGRYVKGFARAYSIVGHSLAGELLSHMSDGHKKRKVA